MKKIVVGFDGSEGANVALAMAASIAAPTGASISVVWAVPDTRVIRSAWGVLALGPAQELDEAVHAAAQAEVDEVVGRLRAQGIDAQGVVRRGDAAHELASEAEAEEADLMVVGCRGFGPIRATLLGSVSQYVMHLAHCPVLVARREQFTSVLLATDGSAGALVAEQMVQALPVAGRMPVRVVSVAEIQHPLSSGIAPTVLHDAIEAHIAYVADAKEAHTRVAEQAAERLRDEGADASAVMRFGDPAAEVLAEAEACGSDLIILGSRGLTGIKRLILGSVATKVVQHAEVSVLIAH